MRVRRCRANLSRGSFHLDIDESNRIADLIDMLPGRGVVIHDALAVAHLMWPSFVRHRGVLLLDFVVAGEEFEANFQKAAEGGLSERELQENFNFYEIALGFAQESKPAIPIEEDEKELARLMADSWTARLRVLGLADDYEAFAARWFDDSEWTVMVRRRE